MEKRVRRVVNRSVEAGVWRMGRVGAKGCGAETFGRWEKAHGRHAHRYEYYEYIISKYLASQEQRCPGNGEVSETAE